MRVVALLSWWHEDPSRLLRCVVPLGRFCDHIVAFDGAYAATPGAELSPMSPGAQADAVVAAAEVAGLGLTLHRPMAPWPGNEVEKRDLMFRAAGLVCEAGDWLFVVDADEVVRDVPANLREQLDSSGRLVATIELQQDDGAMHARRFFSWSPTLRVEGRHFTYVTGADTYLWGDSGEHELALPAHIAGFRMTHEQSQGPRRATQLSYYERRDRLGLEATARVPSGNPPVYAFEPRDGSRHFAVYASPEEFASVTARGEAKLDDIPARVVAGDCDPESGLIRLELAEPYRSPDSRTEP